VSPADDARMSWVLYATGAALIPCLVFAAALLAMSEPGRRRDSMRHPIRAVADALRDNNE
jgi:hypothetical protein